MSHIIGKGRRATTTYKTRPAPVSTVNGDPFVRMGFANSIQEVQYGTSFSPMYRDVDTLLTVPLTGFTPGNIILIGYSVTASNVIVDTEGVGILVRATIDLDGLGPQAIVPSFVGFSPLLGQFTSVAFGWKTFYKPPAESVTSTPIIGLSAVAAGPDTTSRVVAYGALLWAAEVDAAFVTQDPETVLEPI